MIVYGDNTRTQAKVASLFKETFSETIREIEKQFRHIGHVTYKKKNVMLEF